MSYFYITESQTKFGLGTKSTEFKCVVIVDEQLLVYNVLAHKVIKPTGIAHAEETNPEPSITDHWSIPSVKQQINRF
jgi:hypothetical protein